MTDNQTPAAPARPASKLALISQSHYWHDRVLLTWLTLVGLLALVNLLIVFLRVDSSQATTELVYWTVGGVPQFDIQPANRLYVFGLYPLVVAVVSGAVSFRLFRSARSLACLVLVLAALVVVINLVVANSVLQLQ